MDITLFEKINREKLEQVLNCDNIRLDDNTDKIWFESFKKQLYIYSNFPQNDEEIKIRYSQNNKFGRFISKIGLQGFQKDVRNYISGEFYTDFDFQNCHPIILEQLFESNDIVCPKLLKDYNKDRKLFLKKHQIDNKLTMIKTINNEINTNKLFKSFHTKLYNTLINKLIKENKALFDRIKKDRIKKKKNYNHNGSFISHYLQNIENELLMSFYQFLNLNHFTVGSLMFDGVFVLNDERINKKLISEAETYIKKQTNYDIKIVIKSTSTNWVPNKSNDNILKYYSSNVENGAKFSIEHCYRLYNNCYDDKNNLVHTQLKYFMEYLNNFICIFDYPHAYGWRNFTDKIFELRRSEPVADRIGLLPIKLWKQLDSKLNYERVKMIIDKNDPDFKNPKIYNSYKRPSNKSYSGRIEDICPLYFDFIKRVISNNNDDVYNYIINWQAKMVQVGFTSSLICIMGLKGCGKSSFADIVKIIIGNEYFQKIDDITQISSNFNSMYERTILTQVEEVVSNAGDYHKVQSKIKSLTTERDIRIEKKGIDSYMSISHNNFILLTNEINPIKITDDNRRNLILRISNCEQNNRNYFVELKKQVLENIEYLRFYYNTYNYNDDLHSIRPKTEAEANLLELNKNITEVFIEEEMCLSGIENEEQNDDYYRNIQTVYNNYQTFCSQNQKKALDIKYFSATLSNMGYNSIRKRVNGKLTRLVQDKIL